jgi:hypothetical protein
MKITFVAAILPLFTPAHKVDLFHSENGLSCDVCLPAVTISKQPSKTAQQVMSSALKLACKNLAAQSTLTKA